MNALPLEPLESLLADLFSTPKTKFVRHEVSKLTSPGDNCASVVFGVKIIVKSEDTEEEAIEAAVKIPPPSDFLQNIFNTRVTFKLEIDYYKNILPVLKEFLAKKNYKLSQDFSGLFPVFYGSQFSLISGEVSRNTFLVLENLKASGFELIERTIGFDLENARVFLRNIALFHAVPLAMKILDPDGFQRKIKTQLKPYTPFNSDMTPDNLYDFIKRHLEDDEELKKSSLNLRAILDKIYEYKCYGRNNSNTVNRDDFATLIHTDTWTNNFLFKGTRMKVIDFQLYEYGSLAKDLIYFIFSSVQKKVIEDHLDDLIEFYHESLVSVLEILNCNLDMFSFEHFITEINKEAKNVLVDIFFVINTAYAAKEDLDDSEDYLDTNKFKEKLQIIPKVCKERGALTVKIFERRRWIK